MVSIWPRRIRDKIWPEPLPPAGCFTDCTVLVTGATGGLGLAAALHFLDFGANVIITSRTIAKGEEAKEEILRKSKSRTGEKITIMELDMNIYVSCTAFIKSLEESEVARRGIDVAVLNAGLINIDYAQSSEGWEQTLQVHTLSTALLGILLQDFMQSRARKAQSPTPHLIFVTSRKHILPDISDWARISSSDGGILRHLSNEKNWPKGEIDPNYSETKLCLMYAVEKIAKRAIGPSGSPNLIVNTVCPGLVTTDLGRRITNLSFVMRLFVPFYFRFLGKTPEYGARTYLLAARSEEAEHGKCIQSMYTEEEYQEAAITNMSSDTAREVGDLVWKEILDELKAHVPAVQDLGINI